MKSKKIILTFDYELFLNQSGNIEDCILNPITLILKNLDHNNIKAVFFVDILHLYKLKEINEMNEYKKIRLNIHEILKKGHQVELHIHPHWIDAKYNFKHGTWDLSNTSKYQLKSLSVKNASKWFDIGYNMLDEIVKSYDESYQITCFRAGGLCVQPFELFLPLLKKYNIKYECSIAPGMKSNSSSHEYDFLNCKQLTPYRFNNDISVEDLSGEFMEFPINTYEINFLDKIKNKFSNKTESNFQIFGNGTAMQPNKVKQSLFSKLRPSKYFYSFDGYHNADVMINKIIDSKLSVVSIISHPKLMSMDSLSTIDKMASYDCFEFVLYKDFNN